MAVPSQIETSVHIERHYAVTEIAEMWNLSPDKVRELFENEAWCACDRRAESTPQETVRHTAHSSNCARTGSSSSIIEIRCPVGVFHNADHLSPSSQRIASNAREGSEIPHTASAPFGLTEHWAAKEMRESLKAPRLAASTRNHPRMGGRKPPHSPAEKETYAGSMEGIPSGPRGSQTQRLYGTKIQVVEPPNGRVRPTTRSSCPGRL